MNASIYRISLDIHEPHSNVCLDVKRGDTNRKIIISLTDGGFPYKISEECSAVFTGKKPDKKILYRDCTIENNAIIYELTQQASLVPGVVKCEVKLYGADRELITSPKFSIIVDDTVYNEGDEIESDDEITYIASLISGAKEAAQNANDAAAAVLQAKANGEFKGEKGDTGAPGADGAKGEPGDSGKDGQDGNDGEDGIDGKSICACTYTGTINTSGYGTITSTHESNYFPHGLPKMNDLIVTAHGYVCLVTSVAQTTINSVLRTMVSYKFIANLNGEKGDKGDTGANGITPHVGSNGNWFIGETDTGIPATGPAGGQGLPGTPGEDGKDGTSVTVKSVSESTADGGSNVVTFSDGKTLTVKNGSKGSTGDKGDKGDKGDTGADGAKGEPGKDGNDGADGQRGTGILNTTTGITSYTTTVGGVKPTYRILLSTLKTQSKVNEVLVGDTVRYSAFLYPVIYVDSEYAYMTTRVSIQGSAGSAGKNGTDGVDGQDGYTPVRGTDYWTTADQEAIIQDVISALGGAPIFGVVDVNNNIILSGNLADGTYTIKYEDADGTVTEIGTVEVGEKIPTSGYAEITWYDGVKLDKNNGSEGSGTGYCASSYIEIMDGYTYTVKQTMYDNSRYGGINVIYYDADGGYVSCVELWGSDSAEHSVVLTPPANADSFRLRVYYGSAYKPGMWPVYFEKTA